MAPGSLHNTVDSHHLLHGLGLPVEHLHRAGRPGQAVDTPFQLIGEDLEDIGVRHQLGDVRTVARLAFDFGLEGGSASARLVAPETSSRIPRWALEWFRLRRLINAGERPTHRPTTWALMICRVLVRGETKAELQRTSRSWRLRRVGLLLRECAREDPAAAAGLQLHVLDLGGDLHDLLLGNRGADVVSMSAWPMSPRSFSEPARSCSMAWL